MKLSSLSCAPVLVAMVLMGCADNTRPAESPSMEAHRTSATPTTPASTNAEAPMPVATTTTATMTPTTTATPTVVPAPANGQTPPSNDADNTAMNTRDRSAALMTPMDQGNSISDIKITQKIRQSVMGDPSMSFNAKNVKIITKDAHVVLRGVVNTISERQAIEAKAKAAPGVVDVSNQIDVKK